MRKVCGKFAKQAQFVQLEALLWFAAKKACCFLTCHDLHCFAAQVCNCFKVQLPDRVSQTLLSQTLVQLLTPLPFLANEALMHGNRGRESRAHAARESLQRRYGTHTCSQKRLVEDRLGHVKY